MNSITDTITRSWRGADAKLDSVDPNFRAARIIPSAVAPKVAASHEYHDAIVLDVGMPHSDSLEVCRRLRVDNDIALILLVLADDDVACRWRG